MIEREIYRRRLLWLIICHNDDEVLSVTALGMGYDPIVGLIIGYKGPTRIMKRLNTIVNLLNNEEN